MFKKLEIAAEAKRLLVSDPQRYQGLGQRLHIAIEWIGSGQLQPRDLLRPEHVLAQQLTDRQPVAVSALLVVIKRVLDSYEQTSNVPVADINALIALHWLLTDPDADPQTIGAPDIPWRRGPSKPPVADCRWVISCRILEPRQDFANRWYAAVADALVLAGNTDKAATDNSGSMRPAKEFFDSTFATDIKAVHRYLKKYPWVRTEKPSKQRLMIHAGDWMKMRAEVEEAARNEVDAIGTRAKQASKTKQRRTTK